MAARALGRTRWAAAAAAGCAAVAFAQEPLKYADAAAGELLQRAQAAVSHTGPIRDLRSLVLRGRIRVPADPGGAVDGSVEIRILLPDRYMRTQVVGGRSGRNGFVGNRAVGADGLDRPRAQFTTLMLGMLAYAPAGARLTLRSIGGGAFEGTVAVDADGPAFSGRLVLDADSHVPLRMVYFGQGRGSSVSTVISFANRRMVDGLDLPFRITTQTSERVLETLMLDEAIVNPPLRDSDFLVPAR